jgi:hypothetical protein
LEIARDFLMRRKTTSGNSSHERTVDARPTLSTSAVGARPFCDKGWGQQDDSILLDHGMRFCISHGDPKPAPERSAP